MGQVVRANTPVCYSQTGKFDILRVTVINWIKKTIMRQVTVHSCQIWESDKAVCNHWTVLVNWTTGLTFDLELSHKNGNTVKPESVLVLAGD